MTREELFERYVADTLDEEATAELEALLTGDAEFARTFADDLLATGQFEQVGSEIRRIEEGALTGGESGGEAVPARETLTPGWQREGAPPPPARASGIRPPSPPPPSRPIPYQPHRPGGMFGEHHEQPVLRSAQQKSPVALISIVLLLVAAIAVAVYFGMTREPPADEVTAPVIAQIDVSEGSVQLTRSVEKVPAKGGTNLFAGDGLEVGEGSLRIAYVNERTYLHVRAGSQLRLEDDDSGKRIRLVMGQLTAEAGPQPIGRPMAVTTDHAIATLTDAKVTVWAMARETLVEVSEGAVTVERKEDGAQVEVSAGAWALAGANGPLDAWEFVAGVNLNGAAVAIDGNQWLAHAEATRQGLEVAGIEREAALQQAVEPPIGYIPEAGVREVLMTSVAAKSDRLAMKWPQPNGQYQVFVWIMEHEGNQVRSLRLNLEEKLVAEGLGKRQNKGEWNRFGPYPATVTDGSLDVLMSADTSFQNHDPHLCGLAVYRRIGAAPAGGPATPEPDEAVPDAPPSEEPPADQTPEDPPTQPPPVEPPPRLPDLEEE